MKKFKILVEFEYDDDIMHNGEGDPVGKEWFLNHILLRESLGLWSYEIGDEIGIVKVLEIIK